MMSRITLRVTNAVTHAVSHGTPTYAHAHTRPYPSCPTHIGKASPKAYVTYGPSSEHLELAC